MKIGLVTDNTCNLTAEEIKEYDVRIVSLYINRNGNYTKATELNLDEYYEELAAAAELPRRLSLHLKISLLSSRKPWRYTMR